MSHLSKDWSHLWNSSIFSQKSETHTHCQLSSVPHFLSLVSPTHPSLQCFQIFLELVAMETGICLVLSGNFLLFLSLLFSCFIFPSCQTCWSNANGDACLTTASSLLGRETTPMQMGVMMMWAAEMKVRKAVRMCFTHSIALPTYIVTVRVLIHTI